MEVSCRKSLLVVALAGATLSSIGASAQSPDPAAAQKQQQPKVVFDVISVKPNNSGDPHASMNFDQDNFICRNVSLHMLLSLAFHLQDDQFLGEPKWAKSQRWDIAGKIAAEDIPSVRRLTFEQRLELFQEILRARLGLQAHHEIRELPVYAMVVNHKPKLKEVKAPAGAEATMPGWPGAVTTSRGKVVAEGTLIRYLCDDLEDDVGRPIVDRTGLTGRYDFTLTWKPDDELDTSAGSGSLPSLFTALQEQLGLKLVSTRARVDVVVIDHVEMPQAN